MGGYRPPAGFREETGGDRVTFFGSQRLALTLAWAFIIVGVVGALMGVWRIALDGDVMRGLANIIVGGLVASVGEGNRREAA